MLTNWTLMNIVFGVMNATFSSPYNDEGMSCEGEGIVCVEKALL